jgi:hypothetical protein
LSTASEAAGELLLLGQSVQAEAPEAANLPAGQSVHAALERPPALNLPASQAATEPPTPVYPALARQSSSASEEAGELLLDGHAPHVSEV